MSKGIIVVDMPERCSQCRYMYRTDEAYCFCKVEGYGFDYQVNEYMQSKPKGKPDWCPIKPIPKRKDYRGPDAVDGMLMSTRAEQAISEAGKMGWNACIDEILKEEK